MKRQVVLDTETTGLSHEQGHRLIEIAGVELIDRELTGCHFHRYINPERLVDEGAFLVHGISDAFLAGQPVFKTIVDEFLQFIDGSELVIHNAAFDVGFLDAELERLQWNKRIIDYSSIVDTLTLARKKHPGRNSLDALCKRYHIDNTHRTLHGALLDAEILAQVYLAMTGGQGCFEFDDACEKVEQVSHAVNSARMLKSSSPVIQPTVDEMSRHQAFLTMLNSPK